MKFKVLGTGSYIPPKVVTNDDLSKMVDTNDEWISKRVGIKERHISTNDTTSDMATKAGLDALNSSGLTPEDLDLILVATITGENCSPSVAALVQSNIGATCPSMDIGGTACAGFVFAIETASAFLETNKYKNILIIGAERLSSIVDWEDRGTCIIFADGAGAMVVSGEENNLISSHVYTKGGTDVLHIPHTTGHSPFYEGEKVEKSQIFMNGHETYKFAVNTIRNSISSMLEETGLTDEDIKWVVPHQANIRIINEAKRKIAISPEKFCSNIDRVGNTSSASVAILMDELNKAGKIEKGDKIIVVAFGAGLSSGACLIEW